MTALLFLGTAFEWLAFTKFGRIVGLVGALLILLTFAFFKVKAMGRDEERERIDKATKELVDKKEKLDAEISDLSDAELDDRLRKSTS
jgi:large-conductance mechanosensitive channel